MCDDRPGLTPDSLFPNNWISFHSGKRLVLYPMLAENRRRERREDWVKNFIQKFEIREVIDLSFFERSNEFLEGTGSLVLDHQTKVAYAVESPRTHRKPLEAFCSKLGSEDNLY
jgi:hypothetical protein